MQLRVDANELSQALAVLKPVVKSPRIADHAVLSCVHIWGQRDMVRLTANNLTTQTAVELRALAQEGTTSGCLEFATLARFARGAAGKPVTIVSSGPTAAVLTAGDALERGSMLEHTPLYPSHEFPQLFPTPDCPMVAKVSCGELQMALERVTIGGHTTHASAINEVYVRRVTGNPLLTLAYGDSGRVVADGVPGVPIGVPGESQELHFALDGRSVPPLLAFLKAAPAAMCLLMMNDTELMVNVPYHGYVICRLRQTEGLNGFPACAPAPQRLLCDPFSEEVTRAVKMLSGADQREYVRLRGTQGERAIRLSSVEGQRQASIANNGIRQSFDVCVRAYALLDMAKLAHESRLILCGGHHGPLFVGLEDEPYFTYAITDTEWGNRE